MANEPTNRNQNIGNPKVEINLGSYEGVITAFSAILGEVVRQNSQQMNSETISKIEDINKTLKSMKKTIKDSTLTKDNINAIFAENQESEQRRLDEILYRLDKLTQNNDTSDNSKRLEEMSAEIRKLSDEQAIVRNIINNNEQMIKKMVESVSKAMDVINNNLGNNPTNQNSTNANPANENPESTPNPTAPNGNPTSEQTQEENKPEAQSEEKKEGESKPEEEKGSEEDKKSGEKPEENQTPGASSVGATSSATPSAGTPNGTTAGNPGAKPITPQNKPVKKDVKARLLRKSMEQVRILSEPKKYWYKRIFRFANNHPVLATLAGGAIGLGLTALTGPLFYMHMGLANVINYFGITLASGLTAGLGGGIAVAATSNRVLGGKKGKLVSGFESGKVKLEACKIMHTTLQNAAEKSKENVETYNEKAKESKGIFKNIRKKAYRLLRNFNIQKGNAFKILSKKALDSYQSIADKTLATKVKLNELESTPNFRGKTKTMAMDGKLQKMFNLEDKLAKGKIDPETFDYKVQDLDDDVASMKGGEPGLRNINPKHRTFDKEAMDIIDYMKNKGIETETSKQVEADIVERHSVAQVVEEPYLDPKEVKTEVESLLKEGKKEDAQELINRVKNQQKGMAEYRRYAINKEGLPKESVFEVEEPTNEQ